MFQVPLLLKFEIELVEKNWTNYFDLFEVEWALEWVVKKPLGRAQKSDDHLRFLG